MSARGYTALLLARLRVALQYRAAALAGVVTQVFWGFIRVMIFEALYASSPGPHPMTLAQTVSYVWLGQAFFRLLPWSPDPEVRQAVRTGSVAVELVRPLDLYALWYCRAVAGTLGPTLLRSLPLLALALAFFGLAPPAGAGALLACTASLFCAVLLAASFAALQSVTLLYTVGGEGVASLVPILVFMLSGVVIPLPLLPDGVARLMDWLPFRGVLDVPLRLWTGHLPAGEAPALLAHQLAWTLALVLAGRALLARTIRRVEILGG